MWYYLFWISKWEWEKVKKKDDDFSHVILAVTKTAKGGGGAAVTQVEWTVFIGFAAFEVAHAKELRLNLDLGPLDSAAVSFFYRIYNTTMDTTNIGIND